MPRNARQRPARLVRQTRSLLRIPRDGWEKLTAKVAKKLKPHAILAFLMFIYDACLLLNAALPCIPNTRYPPNDGSYIFLYYVLYNIPFSGFPDFGIPKENARKAYRAVWHLAEGFPEQHIYIRPYEVRLAAARRATRGDDPGLFSDVTYMLDGTHTKQHGIRNLDRDMRVFDDEEEPVPGDNAIDYWSYKEGCGGLNNQSLVARDAIVEWTHPESLPAATNDPAMMNRRLVMPPGGFKDNVRQRVDPGEITILQRLCEMLDPDDIIIADGAYVFGEASILPTLNKICPPMIKPRGLDFTPEEVEFNAHHADCRGDIERSFGDLKNKFRILKHPHRISFIRFNRVFRICCALSNLNLRSTVELNQAASAHVMLSYEFTFTVQSPIITMDLVPAMYGDHSTRMPLLQLRGNLQMQRQQRMAMVRQAREAARAAPDPAAPPVPDVPAENNAEQAEDQPAPEGATEVAPAHDGAVGPQQGQAPVAQQEPDPVEPNRQQRRSARFVGANQSQSASSRTPANAPPRASTRSTNPPRLETNHPPSSGSPLPSRVSSGGALSPVVNALVLDGVDFGRSESYRFNNNPIQQGSRARRQMDYRTLHNSGMR